MFPIVSPQTRLNIRIPTVLSLLVLAAFIGRPPVQPPDPSATSPSLASAQLIYDPFDSKDSMFLGEIAPPADK